MTIPGEAMEVSIFESIERLMDDLTAHFLYRLAALNRDFVLP